ncbi:MAG: succinylglutamate desuccinylase/aspartoacylase family protein [Bacteriovoracaceae bacterium]|nr:succinylglutamate desuccinylase/aspartoacylase family protein [Bacteriovoracaceae bacterium]
MHKLNWIGWCGIFSGLVLGACSSSQDKAFFSGDPSAPRSTSELHQSAAQQEVIREFCHKINREVFGRYGWRDITCKEERWQYDLVTSEGNPLIYAAFLQPSGRHTTLYFCAVHGNEIPAAYMCVRLVRDMLFEHPEQYKDTNIVVAPFLNPDGLLRKKPTRTNGRGVDLNRNFPTKDWDAQAHKMWTDVYKKSKRWYPGDYGGSEIETKFQMDLIEKFKPSKIISVHTPYGFFDFDIALGAHHENFINIKDETENLAKEMGQRSSNFRVINYRYFPGSLGNYAGNELGIPTFTLELPGNDARQAKAYWQRFKKALIYLAHFDFTTKEDLEKNGVKQSDD